MYPFLSLQQKQMVRPSESVWFCPRQCRKRRKDMRLHRVQDQISRDCKACLAEWCGHVFGGPSMGCDLAPLGPHFGEAVQSCRQAPWGDRSSTTVTPHGAQAGWHMVQQGCHHFRIRQMVEETTEPFWFQVRIRHSTLPEKYAFCRGVPNGVLIPDARLILGHHKTGKSSAECYGRDNLAKPLRDFDLVLQPIRTKAFVPDSTRSGMIQHPEIGRPVRGLQGIRWSGRSHSRRILFGGHIRRVR